MSAIFAWIILQVTLLPRLMLCISKQAHIFDESKKFHKVLLETQSNLSAIEIQYVVSFSVPEDNNCPILYLRHDDQEESYNAHRGCFDRDKIVNNFMKDKQLWWFKDCSHIHPSRQSVCRVSGQTVECRDTLQIALGYLSKWYISVGYICGDERPIDLTYNISMTKLNITCQTFSSFDFYSRPCHTFYNSYSNINLLGYDARDIVEFVNTDLRMFSYLQNKINGGCYQYYDELGCRTFYPECHNNTIIPPCRQMCWDFVNGCQDILAPKGKALSISCTAYPSSFDPNICVFKEVKCQHPGNLNNGHITINGSEVFQNTQTFPVGSFATYKCHGDMVIAGRYTERTCLLSGQWNGDVPECMLPHYSTNIRSIIIVAILCSILPMLLFYYLSTIQRYMYLKYPYKSHPRKLFSKIYKYDTDLIVHDAFLVHGSTEATRSYINSLRDNVSPDIAFTSNDGILPGQREVPALDKAIAQSRCAMFVMSEDLLESDNIELILDMVTTNRYERTCYWCYFIVRTVFENRQTESSRRTQTLLTHLNRLFNARLHSRKFKPLEFTQINSCLMDLKQDTQNRVDI